MSVLLQKKEFPCLFLYFMHSYLRSTSFYHSSPIRDLGKVKNIDRLHIVFNACLHITCQFNKRQWFLSGFCVDLNLKSLNLLWYSVRE